MNSMPPPVTPTTKNETLEIKEAMRKAYFKEGKTFAQIAKMYGSSFQRVRQIVLMAPPEQRTIRPRKPACAPIITPPVIHMTKEQLYAWRLGERLSKRRAASILGVARNTYAAYEAGRRTIPRYIMLACATISTRPEAA